MKKVIRYFLAVIAYIAFFLLVDDSGVGFKAHIAKIKNSANK